MRLVIVGGGEVGYVFLLNLPNKAAYEVTIISPSEYFTFKPLLAEVVGGALQRESVDLNLSKWVSSAGFKVGKLAHGKVTGVDFASGVVTYQTPKGQTSMTSFDQVVMGVGSTANFSGVPGASEHAFTVQSGAGAVMIKDRVRTLATKEGGEINVVVVGGGATGIETASEIWEYLKSFEKSLKCVDRWKITVVASGQRVLENYSEGSSNIVETAFSKMKEIQLWTHSRVSRVDSEKVEFEDGTILPCKCVVWAAGLSATPLTQKLVQELSHEGERYLATNQWLRIKGTKNAFALGDCSVVRPDSMASQAQRIIPTGTAVPSNLWIADNIPFLSKTYPQAGCLLKLKDVDWTDKTPLSEAQFTERLASFDDVYQSPFKTAQSASQMALWLGTHFKALVDDQETGGAKRPPCFLMNFKGQACYFGTGALMETPDGKASAIPRTIWGMFYRSLAPGSLQNSILGNWMKVKFGGRYP